MVEPPVVFAVPAVTLMIGVARVTERTAGSLSRVTVRGAEMTRASAFWLMNENTAFTPSASRNAVAGLKPLAVSNSILGKVWDNVVLTEAEGGLSCKLFPNARCWACRVPVQSRPLTVLGFIEVSSKRASIKTCLVGVSRLATILSMASSSFSVASTTNWLVRTSAMTLLRFKSMSVAAATMILLGLAYLSWMILFTSGSGAAGSRTVMRAIRVFGSSMSWRL